MIYEWFSYLAGLWWRWTLVCVLSAVPLYILAELLVTFGRNVSSQVKYFVLLVVLLNCITVPLWYINVPVYSYDEKVVHSSPALAGQETDSPSNTAFPSPSHPRQAVMNVSGNTLPVHHCLFGINLIGSFVLACVIFIKLTNIVRHVVHSRRDEELIKTCSRLCGRMRIKMPRVYVVAGNVVPFATGIFSPCLIVPEKLLRKPPEQLELIIAHELAHLKRWDHVVNWLQLAITTVMWWNPVVARINRLLRCEMEHCCDYLVLRLTRIEPFQYSKILLDVAEEQVQNRIHGWVTAFAPPQHTINERIRRITMFNRNIKRYSFVGTAILVFFVFASLLGFKSEGADSKNLNHELEEIAKGLKVLQVMIEDTEGMDIQLKSEDVRKKLNEFRNSMGQLIEILFISEKISKGLVKDEEDLARKIKAIKNELLLAYQKKDYERVKEWEKKYLELIKPDNVDLSLLIGEEIPSENLATAIVRAQVARAESEMRCLKSALEAFFIDLKSYPIPIEGNRIDQAGLKIERNGNKEIIRINHPVIYISSIPKDPFDMSEKHYFYYSDGKSFILSSTGPDGVVDFDVSQYKGESIDVLKKYTYNADNGTMSSGDIIFVGP